jgi:hypothetical protein
MGRQMRQNAVDFLLHSPEIYGALYLFYIALWTKACALHFVTRQRREVEENKIFRFFSSNSKSIAQLFRVTAAQDSGIQKGRKTPKVKKD